jgi:lysozyme family protein
MAVQDEANPSGNAAPSRWRGNRLLLGLVGSVFGCLLAYAGLFTPLPFAVPTVVLAIGFALSWRHSRIFAVTVLLAGLATLTFFFWLFATFTTGLD